jgi:RNA polymerase sigma factor (sigma-70 family)
MRTPDEVYDELLVLRAQGRDREALGTLVDRWQPRLLRHALRLTGDAEAADEVLQEAWLAIVRGLRGLDDPARFPAWAYRIVGNKSADWVRRAMRHRGATRPLDEEPAAPDPPSTGPEPEIAALRRALGQLEPQRRAILSMFYLDGMSVRQIAESFGLPVGTVKSRLHHARNHLKQILERNEP